MGAVIAYALLIGIAGAALTAALIFLTSAQARFYFYGLRQFISDERRRRAADQGLSPRTGVLNLLAGEEALQLITGGPIREPRERRSVRIRLPRWGVDLSVTIDIAMSHPEIFADFMDRKKQSERDDMRQNLLKAASRLSEQWRLVLVTIALFAGLIAGRFLPGAAETSLWALALGVLLTVAFTPAIDRALRSSSEMQSAALRSAQRQATSSQKSASAPEPDDAASLGRPGEHVRALNFASGGFDTLMQLGVIHALVVIHGRAPDVVTGLSSGALNAVALAEVLQAGEMDELEFMHNRADPRAPLTAEELAALQRLRLLARVERLRRFIEGAQHAPERLLDAILPDAFQIEAGRPLTPLQQPQFSSDERAERAKFLSRRTGLAHLYNDALGIPVSIGAIAKIVRRMLALRAASEMTSLVNRWTVRLVEGMRLWLLLGVNLINAARLLPVLLRIYLPHRRSTPGTAGALIFRSRFWAASWRFIKFALSFVVILSVWLAGSLVAFPVYLHLLPPLLVVWLFRRRDPVVRTLTLDALQGMGGWVATIALWGSLALLIMLAIEPGAMRLERLLSGEIRVLKIWLSALGVLGASLVVAAAVFTEVTVNRWSYIERLLASYDLGESIFKAHALRTFLTELFDRNYYARPRMRRAVKAALEYQSTGALDGSDPPPKRVTVGHYCSQSRLEPIHVVIAIANTQDGGLDVAPPEAPVIDAMMAATAATPWLPPVELPKRGEDGHVHQVLYIDGANVTREPTHALMKLLRERRHPEAATTFIYNVAPFPISKPELGEQRRPDAQTGESKRRDAHYLNLVDIVWRAWRLKRFRDATLERRLTELFTMTIPPSVSGVQLGKREPGGEHKSEHYIRAWVTPIELEYDADLNMRLATTSKDDRRRTVEETLADGCRAALQVMIPDAIRAVSPGPAVGQPRYARCSLAVQRHFESRTGVPDAITGVPLPGGDPRLGPGLSEICRRCCIKVRNVHSGAESIERQTLRLDGWQNTGPTWPHEAEPAPAATRAPDSPTDPEPRFSTVDPPRRLALISAWRRYKDHTPAHQRWPKRGPDGTPGDQRPTVSFLFSGGVFRGVYQVGVLNALHEMGVKPDIIAGASVGSITAALIARAFSKPLRAQQQQHVAWLAGVYLGIDRMVLTDRFADFVRNITVRASETRFSIRQADRIFRKYDYPSFFGFERNVRSVMAGLERLFYISPYELNEIVRALRTRSPDEVTRRVRTVVQTFLDRYQIGAEALGAEPLQDLIEEFAIDPAPSTHDLLDDWRGDSSIQFLATATNLTHGRLEVLGEMPARVREEVYRIQALLASSAFPGVFRPRWSWELSGGGGEVEQYIDGGVIDNLPIDAIAQFLHRAAKREVGLVARTPPAPHLIVAASLEVSAPPYALAFTRRRFRSSWVALRARAKQLSYNNKLDMYGHVEDALRRIDTYVAKRPDKYGRVESDLVHMQLMAIKPNWLCGTFAFHPMLGFRREKQARSIAHGCASTLLQFAKSESEGMGKHLRHWGVDARTLPRVTTWSAAFERLKESQPNPRNSRCWLRDCECPFSRTYLEQHKPALPGSLVNEVARIHELCGQRESHLRAV
jgi:predicted acylesterase/phospholipase RssA